MAEYATSHDIQDKPAFAWWVPYVLRKRDQIISAATKTLQKKQYKFGIFVPETIQQALDKDKKNGNALWFDAIEKEMRNVKVAFKILEDGKPTPGCHKFMKCHMIFDVKIDSFTQKARIVAGGHMLNTPSVLTYASVVSWESVRIALKIAALNNLEVKTGDIQNAYLTAPCAEKI